MNKAFYWFRILIFLNWGTRLLAALLSFATGRPAPYWFQAALAGACVVLFAGAKVAPSIQQSGWLYKLYRYRSPAAQNFLAPPLLSANILERFYLHLRPPKWCRSSQDELMLIYRDQNKLLREGDIALGVIVQANAALFKKGSGNFPANVLYLTETDVENPVYRLWEIAHKIFSLKGTKPEDADERKFARMVSYELGRDFRVTVPDSLAQGLDATYTTIMIHRKHLPYGYLTGGYFPLLIHQESRAAMILPARYWPTEIIADWKPTETKDEALTMA